MKKILLILLLSAEALLFAQPAEMDWYKLQSPTNKFLRKLIFIDDNTGWVAGDSGTIVHTSDGGENWVIQNSNVQSFITDIFFIDNDKGWALTHKDVFPFNSIILKTTNGGNTWNTENFQDTTANMRTIFFLDSLIGFLGGTYIARTTDGGTTWNEAGVDSNLFAHFPVNKFKFYNRQFGYACGGSFDIAGVIWRTTDYGLSWSSIAVSVNELFDLFIFDSLNAITLSGDPQGFYPLEKIHTADGGQTWNNEILQHLGLSFSLDFRTAFEGWSASGYGYKFLFTSDKGETWIEKNTPDSSIIYDLQFVDSLTGYACGEGGVILKFGSPPVKVDEEINVFSDFTVYQNYPNPFNPTTVISYQLPVSGDVTLKVYDLLGNDVATLVDEYRPAGNYKIEWDAAGLSSGIYFYKLQTGSLIETKKMVLLR